MSLENYRTFQRLTAKHPYRFTDRHGSTITVKLCFEKTENPQLSILSDEIKLPKQFTDNTGQTHFARRYGHYWGVRYIFRDIPPLRPK